MIDGGNQSFMPSVTSSYLQTDRLEREVQIIMDNYHVFDGYPEIVGKLSDRDTAQIHEGLRLGKQYGAAGYFPLADIGVEQGLTDGYCVLLSQSIENQETRVVSIRSIPFPRISQSYNTSHAKTSQTARQGDAARLTC